MNVQSSILYLVGVLEEALEEEGGDIFGAALLDPSTTLRTGLVAAGECEEGPPEDGQAVAGLGDGGEEDAELGPSTTLRINSLGGAAAVLEGVEVAAGGTGAGAGAAPSARLRAGTAGAGTVGTSGGRHGGTSSLRVGVGGGRSKGKGAGGGGRSDIIASSLPEC